MLFRSTAPISPPVAAPAALPPASSPLGGAGVSQASGAAPRIAAAAKVAQRSAESGPNPPSRAADANAVATLPPPTAAGAAELLDARSALAKKEGEAAVKQQFGYAGQATAQGLNLRFRNAALPPAPKAEADALLSIAPQRALSPQAKPAPAGVLREFQLNTQEGRARIIDQDGSVYEGTVASLPANGLQGQNLPSKGPQSLSQNLGPQRYQVELQGTNRSLQQRVVVRGTLNSAQGQAQAPGASQQNLSPGAWTLNSTVTVGKKRQALDAVALPEGEASRVPQKP